MWPGQAEKITFGYFMSGDRSQLVLSLHSQIHLKPVRPSATPHLGFRLLFGWLKGSLEMKIQGRFENLISKAYLPMANYTLTNCNCFEIWILKLLFKVLVGACVRNCYVLAIRRQLSAWLLPSSMKALSFHTGKSAKRRESYVKVTLTKDLQSAQK